MSVESFNTKESENVFIRRMIGQNIQRHNEFGVPKAGAVLYALPMDRYGKRYPGYHFRPGADLEYFSADLMGVICYLWRELDDPDVPGKPNELATWVSGIATGIRHATTPDSNLSRYLQGALADLETLESVLVMRGRGAA